MMVGTVETSETFLKEILLIVCHLVRLVYYSHLKAMVEFFKTDAHVPLYEEDDCDISTTSYWPFEWKNFYAKLPYDYDVVQLAVLILHHSFKNA